MTNRSIEQTIADLDAKGLSPTGRQKQSNPQIQNIKAKPSPEAQRLIEAFKLQMMPGKTV